MATEITGMVGPCGPDLGSSVGSARLRQLTHRHEVPHLVPTEKHSQYFLRQCDLRHLHPTLWVLRMGGGR